MIESFIENRGVQTVKNLFILLSEVSLNVINIQNKTHIFIGMHSILSQYTSPDFVNLFGFAVAILANFPELYYFMNIASICYKVYKDAFKIDTFEVLSLYANLFLFLFPNFVSLQIILLNLIMVEFLGKSIHYISIGPVLSIMLVSVVVESIFGYKITLTPLCVYWLNNVLLEVKKDDNQNKSEEKVLQEITEELLKKLSTQDDQIFDEMSSETSQSEIRVSDNDTDSENMFEIINTKLCNIEEDNFDFSMEQETKSDT